MKLTLKLKKNTDNKVVYTQVLPENDPFAFPLIPSLYLDKRDIATFGLTKETPRLEVTIKAVA